MRAFEQGATPTPEAFLPRQLSRISLAMDTAYTPRPRREQAYSDFHTYYERFLKVEPRHAPIARAVIHFIRQSDLTYMALLKSSELPRSRMVAEDALSIYRQDQATVNTALKDIGGLAVHVEDAKHGVVTWMRMIEWRGLSETARANHIWLPYGHEETGATVELSITALTEMEQHIEAYQ